MLDAILNLYRLGRALRIVIFHSVAYDIGEIDCVYEYKGTLAYILFASVALHRWAFSSSLKGAFTEKTAFKTCSDKEMR